MFERFIEKSRRVIFFSRWEANQSGAPAIGPEHFLLGMLRENPELIAEFLPADQAESLRQALLAVSLPSEKATPDRDVPLSDESKRVLAYAGQEAQSFGYAYIGPEHLLLGVLCESNCLAAQLLAERGVTREVLLKKLERSPAERRAWPSDEIPYRRTNYRWLIFLHFLLTLAFILLLVQVFGIALENRFYHSSAVFYVVSVPLLTAVVVMLTWFLRLQHQMTRIKMLRYMFLVPIAALPAYILIIRALLSPAPD